MASNRGKANISPNFISVLLLIYLGVMASIGYKGFAHDGKLWQFYGIILLNLVVIVLLNYFQRKRRKIRREREEREQNKEK